MSGKSDVYVLATAATRGSTMVLFTVPLSRQNTFVGGTCAPLSALVARVSHQQPHHVTNHPSTHDMITLIMSPIIPQHMTWQLHVTWQATCHMTRDMSHDRRHVRWHATSRRDFCRVDMLSCCLCRTIDRDTLREISCDTCDTVCVAVDMTSREARSSRCNTRRHLQSVCPRCASTAAARQPATHSAYQLQPLSTAPVYLFITWLIATIHITTTMVYDSSSAAWWNYTTGPDTDNRLLFVCTLHDI